MRSKLTTAIELAGMSLVAAGVGQVSVPAAMIVGGLELVAVGYLAARQAAR